VQFEGQRNQDACECAGPTPHPGAADQPTVVITPGDKLDLTQILPGASLAHDLGNLGNFMQVLGSATNDPGFGPGTKPAIEVRAPAASAIINLEGQRQAGAQGPAEPPIAGLAAALSRIAQAAETTGQTRPVIATSIVWRRAVCAINTRRLLLIKDCIAISARLFFTSRGESGCAPSLTWSKTSPGLRRSNMR